MVELNSFLDFKLPRSISSFQVGAIKPKPNQLQCTYQMHVHYSANLKVLSYQNQNQSNLLISILNWKLLYCFKLITY